MTTSTLSPKNQTTLSVEFVRELKLRAGAKFRQTLENGKIVLQPISGPASAFGSLKPRRKFVSIKTETTAMEKAVGRQVASTTKR